MSNVYKDRAARMSSAGLLITVETVQTAVDSPAVSWEGASARCPVPPSGIGNSSGSVPFMLFMDGRVIRD